MNTLRKIWPALVLVSVGAASAQTLYVPGSVGSISGNNVGIGTSAPQFKLEVSGDGLFSKDAFAQLTTHASSGGTNRTSGVNLRIDNVDLWQLITDNAASNYFYLQFNKNTSQRFFTVTTSGYVGIGTTNPLYKLSVEGAGNSNLMRGHSAGDFIFALAGDGAAGANVDLFSIRNNNTGVVHLNTLNGARLALGASQSTTPGTIAEQVTITSAGNVGIGTPSPAWRLDVVSSSAVAARLSGTNGAQLRFNEPVAGEVFAIGSSISTGASSVGNAPFEIYDLVHGASRVFVNPSGNVGIGTTNPTQKLSVKGTVRAQEVIVDTGWSDYVFTKSYKLKALSEVEEHIKTEGHLPDIPSAHEVAERGISVGEMQAKLLAKIEELTLHAIAQEKRIEALEAKIQGHRN